MASKVIDSDLQVSGSLVVSNDIQFAYRLQTTASMSLVVPDRNREFEFVIVGDSRTHLTQEGFYQSIGGYKWLGHPDHPWNEAYCKKYIVPNGTSAQFLKANGTLDNNAYALHADLNTVKNNAWKLDEANAEVSTVVVALQGNMSVFAAMDKAGYDYRKSRNIYVDMSEADSTIDDIFAGWENVPVGVRYHIFFGNTKNDCKINWNESKVESNLVPSLGITPAYPTA